MIRASFLVLLAACMPDDWNGEPYVPPTGTPVATDTGADTTPAGAGFADTWTSEGDDLSPLFAGEPFNYASVVATFRADLTYSVVATDTSGAETPALTGTYVADDTTVPGVITLTQTVPYEATAVGIWQVEGDVLTYEVVQTVPDYGFVPPTPAGGFGSTGGPNMTAGINTQVYRR